MSGLLRGLCGSGGVIFFESAPEALYPVAAPEHPYAGQDSAKEDEGDEGHHLRRLARLERHGGRRNHGVDGSLHLHLGLGHLELLGAGGVEAVVQFHLTAQAVLLNHHALAHDTLVRVDILGVFLLCVVIDLARLVIELLVIFQVLAGLFRAVGCHVFLKLFDEGFGKPGRHPGILDGDIGRNNRGLAVHRDTYGIPEGLGDVLLLLRESGGVKVGIAFHGLRLLPEQPHEPSEGLERGLNHVGPPGRPGIVLQVVIEVGVHGLVLVLEAHGHGEELDDEGIRRHYVRIETRIHGVRGADVVQVDSRQRSQRVQAAGRPVHDLWGHP